MTRTRKRKADDARQSLGRLERILILVPYCVRNPGVSLDELAGVFGTTPEEVIGDLELIFLCGLPDYTPADLMDVSWEGGHVWIRMADYFARPLRLTRSEAIPLYVRAHALLDLFQARDPASAPGLEELAPLRSALAKLGAALTPQDGGVAELAERIRVELEAGETKWLPMLRDAVRDHVAVDMEYYTQTRDTITQRRVDPYLVFASLGNWYVTGHCHLARDKRLFRLDRIKALDVTGSTFEPPADAAADLPPAAVYVPGPQDARVTLRASPSVSPKWLEEYLYPEQVQVQKGGWRQLTFHTNDFAWLEKLLLRFGSDVEVVDPPGLGDRLRDAASRILTLYERGNRTSASTP